MARCRRCKADLLWVVMKETNRNMPLDFTPNPKGNIVLQGSVARVAKEGEAGTRYISHFVTCPFREESP